MDQIQDAALGNHRVVVEILLQSLPQLKRKFIERLIAIKQVVGPDNGRIPPNIAAANPALFQHGNALAAKFFRQIIRRG